MCYNYNGDNMKNKKGFTLVELLAIIVILAVIMVIAVPQILNVVNGSKNSAWKDNVNLIARAIKNNTQLLDPVSGNYKYSISSLCSNTSKLSEIVKMEDTNVSCSGNVFTLTGTGQFEGKKGTITCNNKKCSVSITNSTELAGGPGLYDGNNNLLASWDELVNTYGMDLNWVNNSDGAMYLYMSESIVNNPENNFATEPGWYSMDAESPTKTPLENIDSNQLAIILAKIIGDKTNVKLIIPDSVNEIPMGAFLGTNLSEIVVPEGVTNIGNMAFAYSTNLVSVNIPSGVKKIAYATFEACSSLRTINIPSTVTSIGECAFLGCFNLMSVNIPNGVVSIGHQAFDQCDNLASITIPASVTDINDFVFSGDLVYLEVDPNNPKYDSRNNCNCIIETAANEIQHSSKSTVIPNTVTSIGRSAFKQSKISSLTIPNSVTSIGTFSFMNAEIGTLIISASVTDFGGYFAFSDNKITTLKVDSSNPKYDSRNNCNCIIDTANNEIVASSLSTIIPSTVTSIGFGAFQGTNKTSISIPNSIAKIRMAAFMSSETLTTITIPSSVTLIESQAFDKCNNLTSIIFENPSGWSRYFNGDELIPVDASELADPAIAATYFTTTYNSTTFEKTN